MQIALVVNRHESCCNSPEDREVFDGFEGAGDTRSFNNDISRNNNFGERIRRETRVKDTECASDSKEEWQPRNKKKADQWKLLWAHPDEKDLLRLALKKGAQAGDVANASDEDIERLRKKAEERKKEDVPDDEEF